MRKTTLMTEDFENDGYSEEKFCRIILGSIFGMEKLTTGILFQSRRFNIPILMQEDDKNISPFVGGCLSRNDLFNLRDFINCVLEKEPFLTTKEKEMKGKENAKPVKKSPMPSRPVKASYEEPMRPKKPNSTSDKGKWQDQGKRKK